MAENDSRGECTSSSTQVDRIDHRQGAARWQRVDWTDDEIRDEITYTHDINRAQVHPLPLSTFHYGPNV
jgi:hypothetical protein